MATLSKDPRGWELEDFIAAHLASRGLLVETGATERDPTDLLELDIVWTDYSADHAPRHPMEVKSGDWGLGDLFKFRGWMTYLELESGWYFFRHLPGRTSIQTLERLCERIRVTLCHVENPADVSQVFKQFNFPAPAMEWLPSLWRYSFWIQRRLLKSLGAAIDSDVMPVVGRIARDYQKLINDAVFFEGDVRARVVALLDAHWDHRVLALSAAAEIAGLEINLADPPSSTTFKQALYYGKHFPVQACLYLEQRARISVLKAAVDYIIARDEGNLPQNVISFLGSEFDLLDGALPSAFLKVVDKLDSGGQYTRNYPILWQTFLWSWGGFILEDRAEREYELLSRECGVPVDEIDGALALWDELFPIDNGWFVIPDTRRQLKLMPAALRGIGAIRRLHLYEVEEYGELGLDAPTPARLASDHNSGVRILDGGDAKLIQ